MPTPNITRQAVSAGSSENINAYSSTAAAQPTAHALCTVPIALPRCSGRIASAIRTAPAAHSPPKPNPCRLLSTRNCGYVLGERAKEREDREERDGPLQRLHAADAVGEHARDPSAERRCNQRRPADQPRLRPADRPFRDDRRNHEAEHLHVEGIECPSAEARPERAPLVAGNLPEPSEHRLPPDCAAPCRARWSIDRAGCDPVSESRPGR